MAWHWQERFQPLDVEDACRLQILKIHKSVSYERWLKKKTQARRDSYEQEEDFSTETKHDKTDEAFNGWLRRKRTQARVAKKQQQEAATQKKDEAAPKPWRKPPSLHVNPKTNGSTRKAEHSKSPMSKSGSGALYFKCAHFETERQHAYANWMDRVRQEDQVRRVLRREEVKRLEQQQREKHKVIWRKKLVVCAYSTLVVDN